MVDVYPVTDFVVGRIMHDDIGIVEVFRHVV